MSSDRIRDLLETYRTVRIQPQIDHRRIHEWQAFLRKDHEGIFTVQLDKQDLRFRFDPRWEELIAAKHQQREDYALFGKDVVYFYDLNRDIFNAMSAKYSRQDAGLHMSKDLLDVTLQAYLPTLILGKRFVVALKWRKSFSQYLLSSQMKNKSAWKTCFCRDTFCISTNSVESL
jgi:hypothetical protein